MASFIKLVDEQDARLFPQQSAHKRTGREEILAV
jgi:hypothetical protein